MSIAGKCLEPRFWSRSFMATRRASACSRAAHPGPLLRLIRVDCAHAQRQATIITAKSLELFDGNGVSLSARDETPTAASYWRTTVPKPGIAIGDPKAGGASSERTRTSTIVPGQPADLIAPDVKRCKGQRAAPPAPWILRLSGPREKLNHRWALGRDAHAHDERPRKSQPK